MGGQGGNGSNGGGAVILSARGLARFRNNATIDVSAGDPAEGTAGAAGMAGASGAEAVYVLDGHTAGLPGQPFLIVSGGHGGDGGAGGSGGRGGVGGPGGAGGMGGEGGLGTPGMVKIQGGIILAKKLVVRCDTHRNAKLGNEYLGKFTWISGMGPMFRELVRPTFTDNIESGAVNNEAVLAASSPYEADLRVPLIPTLVGGPDTSGFYVDEYWNKEDVESALPSDPSPIEVLRFGDQFEGYDQVVVWHAPGAPLIKNVAIGSVQKDAAPVVMPVVRPKSVGKKAAKAEVWTTLVPSGAVFNSAPVMDEVGSRETVEKETVTIALNAVDDGGVVSYRFTSNLPVGCNAVIRNNDDGTATFTWTPELGDAGSYGVTFIATDADRICPLSDMQTIAITVETPNLPPVIVPIEPKTAYAGSPLTIDIAAVDPEGAVVDLTVEPRDLPDGNNGVFALLEPGKGLFTWTPGAESAGNTYHLDIQASEQGEAGKSSGLTAEIVVKAANQPPMLVLDPGEEVAAHVGESITIRVNAVDPEGGRIGLDASMTSVPETEDAVFTDAGDGTGVYCWTPSTVGNYEVVFRAADNVEAPATGVSSVKAVITVTVAAVSEGETENEGEATPSEGAVEQEGEIVSTVHSADVDKDYIMELSELLRVVQLYNSSGYHCDVAGEDGFGPGAGAQECARHSADYSEPYWALSLGELLRVIQLYNAGGYQPCAQSEDGFCTN